MGATFVLLLYTVMMSSFVSRNTAKVEVVSILNSEKFSLLYLGGNDLESTPSSNKQNDIHMYCHNKWRLQNDKLQCRLFEFINLVFPR